MIDLNTLISNALTAAVQQAVAPLNERIATLESANDILHRTQHEAMVAMRDRIVALESDLARTVSVMEQRTERIAALETKLTEAALFALTDRVVALENQAIVTSNAVDARIVALEGDVSHTVQVQQANTVAALAERVAALETKLTEADLFTQNTNVTIPIDEAKMVEALNSQEWFWEKLTRKAHEAAEAVVEEAIDDHLGTYDHDDYDQVSSNLSNYDLDDFVTNSGIEDAVRDALNGTSVTLSF